MEGSLQSLTAAQLMLITSPPPLVLMPLGTDILYYPLTSLSYDAPLAAGLAVPPPPLDTGVALYLPQPLVPPPLNHLVLDDNNDLTTMQLGVVHAPEQPLFLGLGRQKRPSWIECGVSM